MDNTLPQPPSQRSSLNKIVRSYDSDEIVKHFERCMKVRPKWYKWELEGVPTGYKPTRLF